MPARTLHEPQERPPIEVVIAWRAYLRAIRAADAEEYLDVEERAWEHLSEELRRHAVEPPA